MNHRSKAPWRLAILSLAAALGGCGGDSDRNANPVATADALTVNWNSGATELALTANDSDPDGDALTITQITTPAHGTATLTAGKVSYTPATGYVGTDTFQYTIGDGRHGSATGTVTLTVQAAMTLKGRAFDAPLANAVVTASVGGRTFTTTADAKGNYSLPVTSDSTGGFITLTAAGVGAQATVKLTSLVGEVGAVATSAEGLNVTHVSTALAALATAANGGSVPTTQAALASASAQVGADSLLQMAAIIKLVADEGVPLPAGVADTAALVGNPTTYNAFAEQQVQNNADALQAATTAVQQDPNLNVPPPATIANAITRLYYIGRGCCSLSAMEITLKPDGNATVLDSAVHDATWKVADGATVVTYKTPAVSHGFSSQLFNGQQANLTFTTTGVSIRQLTGTAQAGVATLAQLGTTHYDGNEAPDEVNTDPGYSYVFTDAATLSAPSVAELAANTYAGVPNIQLNDNEGVQSQDVMLLNADGTGKLQRAGSTFSWSQANGKLVLSYANGLKQTIQRLLQAADGEERWLVRFTQTTGGVATDVSLQDAMVVKVNASLAFSDALATNEWKSYVNAGTVTDPSFGILLNADHLGMQLSIFLSGNEEWGRAISWQVNAGQLVQSSYLLDNTLVASCVPGPNCVLYGQRYWTLLNVSGTKHFVMERLYYPSGFDQYRINRYEALKPVAGQAASQSKAASYRTFALTRKGK